MLLIPAIDLKDGHCVRLKQGDMDQATIFSEDPADMARTWLKRGARRLHLVDLNGAFAGKPQNIAEKMVAGKMEKFYEDVCLLEQPFIKDQAISVGQLIATKVGKLGENIAVRRFARFKVGDAGETVAITKPAEAKPE